MSEVPKDRRYAPTHEWALKEGDHIVVGITEFAVSELGDLVYIDLPQPGTEISQGDSFGEIESVKAVSELNAPISGKVVEVNEDLSENLDLLAESPYEDGWMIKIEPTEASEYDELLSQAAYKQQLADHE